MTCVTILEQTQYEISIHYAQQLFVHGSKQLYRSNIDSKVLNTGI